MSVRVMHWVWTESNSESTDRLVLLAIADCANDDGRDAYPSLATLATKARLHKRTVQRAIDQLVAMGELAIQEHGGPGRANRYRVTMRPGTLPADVGTEPTAPVGAAPIRQNAHTAPHRQSVGTRPTGSRHSATTDVGAAPTEPPIEPSITVKEPPVPAVPAALSVTQRSKRITDAYAEAEPMCRWPAVNGVVMRAIKAEKWTDGEIHAAVLRLAAEGRSVTVETLRIELDGLPPSRAAPRGYVEHNGRQLKAETAANLDLIERIAQREQQQPAAQPAIERGRR